MIMDKTRELLRDLGMIMRWRWRGVNWTVVGVWAAVMTVSVAVYVMLGIGIFAMCGR